MPPVIIMKVIIEGNGAIKVDGRYIYYKKGEPVTMPESAAKRTGKEYKVISRAKTAVVEQSDKRDYPIHTHAGWYELSNGEKVRGKEEAIKAQKELDG